MTRHPYRTHDIGRLFRRNSDVRAFMDEVDAIEPPWTKYETAPDAERNMNGVKQQIIDLKEDEWGDIYAMVDGFARAMNRRNWQMKLTGFNQPLRVARYTPGYYHDWHLDYMPTDGSKLAMSAPLNDGYTGGEFQLMDVPPFHIPRGNAVVFPAFHAHRVTEVTDGVRYVLLAWFTGPRFI